MSGILVVHLDNHPSINDTIKQMGVLLHKRDSLIEDIYGIEDEEFEELEGIEKEYEALIQEISHSDISINEVSAIFEESNTSRLTVAAHLALVLGDISLQKKMISLAEHNQKMYDSIKSALHLCSNKLIEHFFNQHYQEDKATMCKYMSSVSAKRGLSHAVKPCLELSKDDITGDSGIFDSFALLGEEAAKVLYQDIIDNEASFEHLKVMSANHLLYLKDEKGFSVYHDYIKNDERDGTIGFNIGKYDNPNNVKYLFDRLAVCHDYDYIADTILSIGFFGDPINIPKLLPYLRHENSNIRIKTHMALEQFNIDANDEVDANDETEDLYSFWSKWWLDNESKFNKRYRYRDGEPFDITSILSELLDNDIEGKRAAHESLIVYTGQYFPFDEYAYLQKQLQQFDVWKEWIEKNREKLPIGKWFCWGQLYAV